MWAIINSRRPQVPSPSLEAKGNQLTYTRVKQENLAEMEIWATTLGYT